MEFLQIRFQGLLHMHHCWHDKINITLYSVLNHDNELKTKENETQTGFKDLKKKI